METGKRQTAEKQKEGEDIQKAIDGVFDQNKRSVQQKKEQTDCPNGHLLSCNDSFEETCIAGCTSTHRKRGILVVSFGTSYGDTREETIGAIEAEIARSFPEYEVRRAFTSGMVLELLRRRDGIDIDDVGTALERMWRDGIQQLIVQPTHLMNGLEYHKLKETAERCRAKFEKMTIGAPLLHEDADYENLIQILTERMAEYDDGETAICLMGHGTEAESNIVYTLLQQRFRAAGYENYLIGTVEADPSRDDIYASVRANEAYKRVVLAPLLVVAGDHANNDMAGEKEDSWKSTFEAAGYEVVCLLVGLGQIPEICEMYADHVRMAEAQLK